MSLGSQILQDVNQRANERQHEVWFHVMGILRDEKHSENLHYPFRKYVKLKLERHKLNKLLFNDIHYNLLELRGMTTEEITEKLESQIAKIDEQIAEIKSNRENKENQWESYLP